MKKRPVPSGRPLTLCVAVADHFEPWWAGPERETALERVRTWVRRLPLLGRGLADCRGSGPKHDFFYPGEEYDPEVLDMLAGLRADGLGEVEIHLHHGGESPAQVEDMLASFARLLHERHGLLRKDAASGRLLYGFIHGNWALDNSLPDGSQCGINNELQILRRTGCYADFTLPASPSPAQTATINSIYYATDDPQRPKSHNRGIPARVGQEPRGDLLLVQGVLAYDWSRRKLGLLPRIENSDLAGHHPPSPARVGLWLRWAPSVLGAEHVRFLKLHCHGAPEKNHEALLGGPMRQTLEHLCKHYNDGEKFRLVFCSCWEMTQAIHALEKGESLPW